MDIERLYIFHSMRTPGVKASIFSKGKLGESPELYRLCSDADIMIAPKEPRHHRSALILLSHSLGIDQ